MFKLYEKKEAPVYDHYEVVDVNELGFFKTREEAVQAGYNEYQRRFTTGYDGEVYWDEDDDSSLPVDFIGYEFSDWENAIISHIVTWDIEEVTD